MMNQIINKLKSMIVRGTILSVNDTGSRQEVTAKLSLGETKDRIERIEQFGFSSVPPSGAAGVFLEVAATRSRMVCIGDSHYTHCPRGKQIGESIQYDAFGQFIHLQASGVIEINASGQLVIKAPTKVLIETAELEIQATSKVRMETPLLEITGDIKDNCDASGTTMGEMRNTYNTHTHDGDSGGTTGTPDQTMGGGI